MTTLILTVIILSFVGITIYLLTRNNKKKCNIPDGIVEKINNKNEL